MDFNMNLYKGCCHGCVYCDSRSKCYQVADFDIVKGKQNALAILEMELRKKRKKMCIRDRYSSCYGFFKTLERKQKGRRV